MFMADRSTPRMKLSPDPDPGKDTIDCVELKSQHNNASAFESIALVSRRIKKPLFRGFFIR